MGFITSVMDNVILKCRIDRRSVVFLFATFLTEPGIIPKGTPLTQEQIKNITETPCTQGVVVSSSGATAASLFSAIRDGNYNRINVFSPCHIEM